MQKLSALLSIFIQKISLTRKDSLRLPISLAVVTLIPIFAFQNCSQEVKFESGSVNPSSEDVVKQSPPPDDGGPIVTLPPPVITLPPGNTPPVITPPNPPVIVTPASFLRISTDNPMVREGSNGIIAVESSLDVTDLKYSCKQTDGLETPVAYLQPGSSSVSVRILQDTVCTFNGKGSKMEILTATLEFQINCENRMKESGRCVDFQCRSFVVLPATEQLSIPPRTAEGICYSVPIMNRIANSSSRLTTQLEMDVVSRDHDVWAPRRNPYVLGKYQANVQIQGPRVVKLAGGLSTTSPIRVDNFLLFGLFPQSQMDANPNQVDISTSYKAMGTSDSVVPGVNGILFRDIPIPVIPFASAGTSTIAPLDLSQSLTPNLPYVLDLRALDCGGSRELSDIHLLFQ